MVAGGGGDASSSSGSGSSGTYGDVLILTLHKVIVDCGHRATALFPSLLTIIQNTAPFLKGLGLPAAQKLVRLLELFSSRRFLFSAPDNWGVTAQILDALNSAVRYQFESNTILVYLVVRRKDLLERLCAMEVGGGVGGGSSSSSSSSSSSGEVVALAIEQQQQQQQPHEGEDEGEEEEEGEEGEGGQHQHQHQHHQHHQQHHFQQWHATPAWWEEVRASLPLKVLLRLVDYLHPRLDAFCTSADTAVDSSAVLSYLRRETVADILPPPGPIQAHLYKSDALSQAWFTKLMWSTCFLFTGRVRWALRRCRRSSRSTRSPHSHALSSPTRTTTFHSLALRADPAPV